MTEDFLAEDLDTRGDITSDTVIKGNPKVTAIVKAKENGIVAGLEETKWFLTSYKLQATSYKKDGNKVGKGEKIFQLKGGIKDVLKIERTILNLLQRMSGIATQTTKLVKLTHGKVLICPTRKTQWGLLDKKAVVLGGGGTHRLGLYDWILVKDNHITHSKTYNLKPITSFWEIEAKTKKQVLEFAKLNPDAIMFDNFKPKNIKGILEDTEILRYSKDIIFEVSGGITEKNITEYAKTGVDIISLGSLTHSTKALDISLDII
ncbi:MAG: nicotinate-nucleotide diphosphorylase (carboxylating) [Candidatus Magasanikbacteria bacterium RIFOXYC2_FULL_39_8]|nr:MAG: nicotinate-nucleotide diphosphorylase (carboxylating) [Candidatus Magasanikbacteria bacterium RIFOXYC2_FULL_39_8]